jgi:flagellar basal body-associated protein FliL
MDETPAPAKTVVTRMKRSPAMSVGRPELAAAAGLLASLLLLAGAVLATAPSDKSGARSVSAAMPGPLFHHALPEVVAVLGSSGAKSHHVLLAAVVELSEEAVATLNAKELEVVAEVQAHLRTIERKELAGVDGMERLRLALLAIVNRHIAPARARTILFTRLLY